MCRVRESAFLGFWDFWGFFSRSYLEHWITKRLQRLTHYCKKIKSRLQVEKKKNDEYMTINFKRAMWGNGSGRKLKSLTRSIQLTCAIQQNNFINGLNTLWSSQQLMIRLKVVTHHREATIGLSSLSMSNDVTKANTIPSVGTSWVLLSISVISCLSCCMLYTSLIFATEHKLISFYRQKLSFANSETQGVVWKIWVWGGEWGVNKPKMHRCSSKYLHVVVN